VNATAPSPTRRCGRCGMVDDTAEFRGAICRRCARATGTLRPRPAYMPATPDAVLLEDLVRWWEERGEWPTRLEWSMSRPPGTRCAGTYIVRFGGWESVIYTARRHAEKAAMA
jgi:hypothetical protein